MANQENRARIQGKLFEAMGRAGRKGSKAQKDKNEFPDEPTTIGNVPQLAPGSINLMWGTHKSIVLLSAALAKKPLRFKQRKFKKVTQSSIQGYWMKQVEIPEEDEEPVEEK